MRLFAVIHACERGGVVQDWGGVRARFGEYGWLRAVDPLKNRCSQSQSGAFARLQQAAGGVPMRGCSDLTRSSSATGNGCHGLESPNRKGREREERIGREAATLRGYRVDSVTGSGFRASHSDAVQLPRTTARSAPSTAPSPVTSPVSGGLGCS